MSLKGIYSRFRNVITILPNLVPDVKFWENSITLKKGKKNQRKNLWSYKKISSNQNPTNLKCPMSRADHDRRGLNQFLKKHQSAHFTMHDAHYFMQLAKDFKAKSKRMSRASYYV